MGIVAVFLLAAEIHSASTKSNRMIALSGAKNLHRDIRRIPMDVRTILLMYLKEDLLDVHACLITTASASNLAELTLALREFTVQVPSCPLYQLSEPPVLSASSHN